MSVGDTSPRNVFTEMLREFDDLVRTGRRLLRTTPGSEAETGIRADLRTAWALARGRISEFFEMLDEVERISIFNPVLASAWREVEDALRQVTWTDRFDGDTRGALSASLDRLETAWHDLRQGILGVQAGTPTERGANPIPPARRTRPMTLSEAARHMAVRGSKPAEKLKRQIDSGVTVAFPLNRQSWIFDLDDFPAASHPRVKPTW
jgi:hypothetical protein